MTLRRRTLLGAGAALATPGLACAQGNTAGAARPKIYMLLWRGWEEACDGFRDYLASRHIDAEYVVRDAGQRTAPIAEYVREINQVRPALVFIWGGSTAVAALGPWDRPDPERGITGAPSVLAIVSDPVGSKLVRSAAQPGREVTGTIYVAPADVQMRVMRAYRPFKTFATLYNPAEESSAAVVRQMAALAARDGVRLIQRPVPGGASGQPDAAAVPELVRGFRENGAEWLYIPPDTFLNDHRDALTAAALAHGLPAFSATERFVSYASGLAGLVCRYYNIGRFAGFKAEQILFGGKRASEIPVETLTRFSLLIRMETAKKLGVYPPLALLRYAEPV